LARVDGVSITTCASKPKLCCDLVIDLVTARFGRRTKVSKDPGKTLEPLLKRGAPNNPKFCVSLEREIPRCSGFADFAQKSEKLYHRARFPGRTDYTLEHSEEIPHSRVVSGPSPPVGNQTGGLGCGLPIPDL
jgi:hypothetical protein